MALIGSMILDPEAIPKVRAMVSPADFYVEKHVAIASAIGNGCPDLIVLQDRLRRAGALEGVGGTNYIVSLAECVPSAANWPHYAKIVVDKARARSIIGAASETIHRANTTTNVDELTDFAVSAIGSAASSRATTRPFMRLDVALDRFIERIDSGKPQMFPTGLRDFDDTFGGFPVTGLVVVMGVSSSGKSSLILNMLPAVAKQGGVRIYSFEMGPENTSASVASAYTGVSLHGHARHATPLSRQEREEVQRFRDMSRGWDVEICTDNPSASDIYRRTMLDARAGVKCIVIDYIQNLPRRAGQDDVAAISEACRTFQAIHREHGVLVVAVSQMTLQSGREKRPPQMSDGRGAGEIGNAADMMVGVYRPAVWESPDNYEGGGTFAERQQYTEIHVPKNKYGPIGMVNAKWIGSCVQFKNMEVPVDFPK